MAGLVRVPQIDPVEVTYEQLIDNWLLTMNAVLEHLGLPQLDSDALPSTR